MERQLWTFLPVFSSRVVGGAGAARVGLSGGSWHVLHTPQNWRPPMARARTKDDPSLTNLKRGNKKSQSNH